MASAELMKMVQAVDDRVQDVGRDVRDDVQDVGSKVQDVDDKVQNIASGVRGVDDRLQDVGRDVRGDVRDVGNKVQGVDDKVQGIASEVRGVDNKLDQANRSLSLYLLLIVSSTQTALQGISSKIAFSDGSRLQIHPSIITSRLRLIIRVRPNGFFKAVYSINGNPLAPFCGYMESVRLFLPLPSDDL